MTDYSNTQLVTLAAYLVGAAERPVDTEDVAIKAHELAPTRFSWRKYPEHINLELVRVYLSEAKSPERGSHVEGSGKKGWTLTPRGVTWARAQQEELRSAELDRPRDQARGGPPGEQRWRRERQRILDSSAWKEWCAGSRVIHIREAEALFRIDSYADNRMRGLKTQRLCALFDADHEVLPFLEAAAAVLATTEK